MPIYEYQCDSCSYKFEVKQSMKDDPISTCERCGQPVRRLISSPGIMFKGSGWYVTDYSDKLKPPSSTGGEAGGAGAGEKKEAAATASTTSTATTPAATPTAPTTHASSTSSSATTPSAGK